MIHSGWCALGEVSFVEIGPFWSELISIVEDMNQYMSTMGASGQKKSILVLKPGKVSMFHYVEEPLQVPCSTKDQHSSGADTPVTSPSNGVSSTCNGLAPFVWLGPLRTLKSTK